MPLAQLLRGYDLAAAHARLGALMKAEGLPWAPRDHASNTRLSQELACWAADRGVDLDDALFRAVFAEGKNVGDPEVLVALASDAGLPADEARAVLTERRYRDNVDQDWAFARQVGVTGVPTYAVERYAVVGAQPYEVLAQLAERAGVRARTAPT
jgi:predicted DsbA family dithiol-disulfide isomerase